MKFFIALALMVACASAASLDLEWNSYKIQHGKVYSATEETVRRAIWAANTDLVASHNAAAANGVHSYTLKMNKFGDLTVKEFVHMVNGFNQTHHMQKKSGSAFIAPANFKAPASVDWRTKGYVTPIKDQGQCGSCWAFSAIAGLEGQHFAKTQKLVSLSEQNLVDCSGDQGNQGCNGGLMDQAFDYIKIAGVDTEKSYPYTAEDGECSFDKKNVGATLTGYTDIPSGDEDALTAAVASVGPISVAIDASHGSFQLYSTGVYNERACSSQQLDHGVTAVGYGTDGGKKFFLVKNSWGTGWGMDGYIQMTRDGSNQCGIATSASYPLV